MALHGGKFWTNQRTIRFLLTSLPVGARPLSADQRGSVVGGKDDEGVLVGDRGQDAAHGEVQFADSVAVDGSSAAGAREGGGGVGGGVGRVGGEVEEEGGAAVAGDELQGGGQEELGEVGLTWIIKEIQWSSPFTAPPL